MDVDKSHRRYLRLKHKVEAQLQQLQQQRQDQLAPSRLYLPAPWQPIVLSKPMTMYKLMAVNDGKFMSVYDKHVEYAPKQWTHARYGCKAAWPPLWSCMYVYPTAAEARSTVFPRVSHQQKGARVLVRVQAAGKGYSHPDGRVAVSSLMLEEVVDYVPKGPKEKVVSLNYSQLADE